MGSTRLVLVGALLVVVAACGSSAASQGASPTASAAAATETASASPSANLTDAYPFLAGYTGHFAGTWSNKTFGSTGSMTWDMTADATARTIKIDVAVGGPVFGGPGVKPESILLTHLADGVIGGKSPAFGDVSGTITPNGLLTITLSNVPGGTIAKVTITGTFTGGDSIAIAYSVEFAGGTGTAAGTASLKKS